MSKPDRNIKSSLAISPTLPVTPEELGIAELTTSVIFMY